MEQWSSERFNFWDTAIRGSSALQAALYREVGHVMASYMDQCSVGLYWDLKKFFIRWILVACSDSP